MTQQRKPRTCRVTKQVAECLREPRKAESVVRELDLVAQGAVRQEDPIQEQLRKCPEAFQAGDRLAEALKKAGYVVRPGSGSSGSG